LLLVLHITQKVALLIDVFLRFWLRIRKVKTAWFVRPDCPSATNWSGIDLHRQN